MACQTYLRSVSTQFRSFFGIAFFISLAGHAVIEDLCRVGVAQPVGRGHRLGDEVTPQGGEALREHRIPWRHVLYAVVRYLHRVL